jgi:hypothetical protein
MGEKTFKSDSDAVAGVSVSKTSVRMNGNRDNYVLTDEKGTTISGPTSFVSGSDQIRIGGLWTMNNQLLLSLPSTMATPTPVLMINPPVKQLASVMADATVMIGLLSGFSGI